MIHAIFTGFLDLLRVVIWPLTVLCVIYLFRPISHYLFLSLRSFNILGAKGEIKPVDEVIKEKAEEMIRQEKEREFLLKIKGVVGDREFTEDDFLKIDAIFKKKGGGVTLAELTELYIALDIIPADKALQARAVYNQQGGEVGAGSVF